MSSGGINDGGVFMEGCEERPLFEQLVALEALLPELPDTPALLMA